MDASVLHMLHKLWDLRVFVTILSRSIGPLKGSGWTTRLAIVGKIPLLSLSVLVHRRARGGPSSCARKGPGRSVSGYLPGAVGAGWKRRARCPAGGAAALREASLRVLPRTECGRRTAAGGAGQWPSELRPRPHSRCGPRSATRSEESRDRARCPTPWLAFNRSPIVSTGAGTQWGWGPELALVVWASPVTLRGHGPSWPFISFSCDGNS